MQHNKARSVCPRAECVQHVDSFIDSSDSDLVLVCVGLAWLSCCFTWEGDRFFPAQNLRFFSGRAWTGLQHWQCVTFIHFSIHSFMRLADAFIQSDLTLYFRDRCYQFMHSLGIWMFCVSILQADQLMFALHFVKGMNPDLFQENVSVCVCVSHNESWRNDNVSVLARRQQRLWQDKYVVISPSSKAQ